MTGRRRTLDLPLGRPVCLNAERSGNRWDRAKATAYWREQTGWLLRAARWQPLVTPVRVAFHGVYVTRRGLPDPDGILPSAKAALDAMVDLGLLPGDDARWVPWRCYGAPLVLGWDGLRCIVEESVEPAGNP